jgi:hypothetical protein
MGNRRLMVMARGQPINFDDMGGSPPDPHEVSAESAEREPTRVEARQMARPYSPPEPHQRYEIDPRDIPPGMDAQWVVLTVKGAPGPNLGRYYRNQWIPAAAADFPHLSGYGTVFPDQLVDAGLITNVKANDPVLDEDKTQILMLRPKEITQKAEQIRKREAQELVATQMERLSVSSRRHIRDRTEVRRQFANADAELAQAGEI